LRVNSGMKSWWADAVVAIVILFVRLVIMKIRGPLVSARYCRLIIGTCAALGLTLEFFFVVAGAVLVGVPCLLVPVVIGDCLALRGLTIAYVFAKRSDRWFWMTSPFSVTSLVLFAFVSRAIRPSC